VARFFRELGAYIFDADVVGHEVTEPGLAAYQQVVKSFGKGILDSGGRIDRRKLGPKVFADLRQLRRLNAIVHPHIISRVKRLAAGEHKRNPHAVVIVDAALIFEAGMEETLRKVIVVWCRPEQQLERLVAKTGLSREEAERRIEAQMPGEEKRRRADFEIDCSGTLEESREQVKGIYPKLLRLMG
jgi:dephospho-CoA kinase